MCKIYMLEMLVLSFQYFLYEYYAYIKCFCIYKWAYLVFPSVYSVLDYHGYTNADIDPWTVRNWLNIFPIPK